jgi:hypothetical protein
MKTTTTTVTYKKVFGEQYPAPYFVQGMRSSKYYTLGALAKDIYEHLESIVHNNSDLDVTVIFEEVIGE